MALTKSRVGRPFRRRRLAKVLVELREACELTSGQAAQRAEVAQATVSRAENAATAIALPILKSLLDVYGVVGDDRERVLDLARSVGQETFWHSYHDVLPDWFQWYVDLESEAARLECYDVTTINGLLQTEAYARATFEAYHPDEPPHALARKVEMRMRRQERLDGGDLQLCLVVEEWVLRRLVGGPHVMHDQVVHLRKAAELRHVELQVMPMTSLATVTGPFTVMDFPDAGDPSVVYLEHESGSLFLERLDDVRTYSRVFSGLRAKALSPDDSIQFLDQLLGVPA